MDVFTFLQELNVIDSKNKNTMFYYKLFDYSEQESSDSNTENKTTGEESKASPAKLQSNSGITTSQNRDKSSLIITSSEDLP